MGDIRYLTFMPFPGVDISMAAQAALSTAKMLGDSYPALQANDIP